MTTNDIDAIRKELRPYTGAGGPAQSYRAHNLAKRVPALCDEIEQLRAELAKAIDLKERYARTAANLVQQRDNHAAQADRFAAELAKVRRR